MGRKSELKDVIREISVTIVISFASLTQLSIVHFCMHSEFLIDYVNYVDTNHSNAH